jgi:hypothetical protein
MVQYPCFPNVIVGKSMYGHVASDYQWQSMPKFQDNEN